jgi:hypothetical protein
VRVEKTLLRLDTDFIDEDMAGVAKELIVVHGGAREYVAQREADLRSAVRVSLLLF